MRNKDINAINPIDKRIIQELSKLDSYTKGIFSFLKAKQIRNDKEIKR